MPALLIVGLVFLALGLGLFFAWFGYIVALIKALLPAALIGAGALAAYLGWEEMKDQKEPNMDFSSPDEANRYKSEARTYQEKINEIVVIPGAADDSTGSVAENKVESGDVLAGQAPDNFEGEKKD